VSSQDTEAITKRTRRPKPTARALPDRPTFLVQAITPVPITEQPTTNEHNLTNHSTILPNESDQNVTLISSEAPTTTTTTSRTDRPPMVDNQNSPIVIEPTSISQTTTESENQHLLETTTTKKFIQLFWTRITAAESLRRTTKKQEQD
jgi:hypothetical protein